MSRENVEVVRRWYEAVSRGDLDALMESVSSDAEFVNENIGGTYRGREQIRKMFEEIWEVVEDYRVEPEELLIEHGDQVVVSLRVSGRFRHTGISEDEGMQAEMAHVLTIRNGKIVRNHVCRDKARALEEGRQERTATRRG
jgi:ketosteroid isomerase-like protein